MSHSNNFSYFESAINICWHCKKQRSLKPVNHRDAEIINSVLMRDAICFTHFEFVQNVLTINKKTHYILSFDMVTRSLTEDCNSHVYG